MDITVNAPKALVQTGAGFFELFLGADAYATYRNGEAVKITTTDGEVEGTVVNVAIGPLGQFLGMGQPHVSALGKAYDVRNLVDALEARAPKGKAAAAIDPRTLYTAVYVNVPYVAPVFAVPGAPAV
jgi:hypothetical protein